MRTRHQHLAMATAIAATAALFGCAGAPPAATQQATVSTRYGLAQAQPACEACHAEFIRALHLSPEQGHALRAAMKDTIRATNPMMALLRDLTLPRPMAPMALSQGLDVLLQLDATQDARTLERIRAVLMPSQRAQLAEAMREFPTTHAGILGTMADRATAMATQRLKFTPIQQALFAAVAQDYERFWQAHKDAYMEAIARHLVAGGEAELRASLAALASELSTDSTVAFLGSLSPHQQRQLITSLQRFHQQMVNKVTRMTVAR
ncbi:MAG: hypothetical protein VKQ33_04170 [Candidatus Sericytochromatia bacterium]|nr:hypothetical protein [Candidatus Sericytochromatia bacterium]